VLVYHVDDPSDLYTQSLARDVQFEDGVNPRTRSQPSRIIGSPSQLPSSICAAGGAGQTRRRSSSPTGGTLRPSGRGHHQAVRRSRAALLIGDDSVDRFMANDAARATVRASHCLGMPSPSPTGPLSPCIRRLCRT
jgi:hypothetical protein